MKKKIALLIDIDNVKISGKAFNELFEKLNEKGEFVYCKFYGYNDRKHIYLSDFISKYGYETAPFMRFKKRVSQLDTRIIVDAVKLNYAKPEINAFCIVAGDGDLIPLLVELKSSGKYLMDINSIYHDINAHMFDETVELSSINEEAEVYTSSRAKVAKLKPKPKAQESKKAIDVAKVEEVKPDKQIVTINEEDDDNFLDEFINTDNVQQESSSSFNLGVIIRDITERYNELDFSNTSDMPKKLQLINDIEALILNENKKGEGLYSADQEIKEIFNELQDIVDEMKNAL